MSPLRFTVSSGSGPREVRTFVRMLAEALTAELGRRGARVAQVVTHGEPEEPSSVDVVADAPPGTLADWLGTHALVMRSARREKRDRKRWYAAIRVCELPVAKATLVRREDVAFETCRAGGAGGQHVNRTESAVRALHRPSGIAVRVESERSQHQNRATALELLTRALSEREDARVAEDASRRRLSSLRVERGRPVLTWTCDERRGLVRD